VMSKSKPGKGLHVLVMDDEAGIRSMCREVLEGLGCAVDEAGSIAAAQEALSAGSFQLAIFDVRLPDGSGLDLFHKTRSAMPDLCIAIVTGHASVEDAIEAVKAGACDYITKPFDIERLRTVVEIAAGGLPAVADSDDLFEFHGIIGVSKTVRSLCNLIERAAQAPSTVLIQGESGTGKEMAAKAVHLAGPNAKQPFVPVDCSSIPGGLLESELFGHVKGAFTGAHAEKDGLFRSAGSGTVFLDEIGELPPALQAKLLRALQEREVRPVGATRPKPFGARVIVATNRDLQSAMADGEFRRDLFYRLHVIPICMPPLRSRREDVTPLAQFFLDQLNAAAKRSVEFTRAALNELAQRKWPGNVRELQNTVERAFALMPGDVIDAEQLGEPETEADVPRGGDRLEDYEKQAIQAALLQAGGNRDKAAKILGIGVATLFRKLKKYNLN
jgi:DNA-binding NtrC family response regulator